MVRPVTGGWFEVHGTGPVRLVPLSVDTLTIGRAPGNELPIDSRLVSRLHALVERFPSGWIIRDLGSTNGTTVNGAPLREARTLRDGDRVEVGPARLVFRAPGQHTGTRTVGVEAPPAPPALTRREGELLDALCRPYLAGGDTFPEPPAVRVLAGTLGVSESAVKKHLTRLYDKFGLVSNDDRRRARLAAEAVRRGAVS
ncbi:FHA domain-containing protein [Micromonospora halotolerans]|uniref:FHA domain-containing protein n=1 Tax=Micromonospora halotolerans TaxID=709879 RepID=A0ABZ0A2U9_9ACTN|nr:FHA domain-containing protein [Micromonospora halotolerans]WNM41702.1 FHA domain-containing protein [Micromonospora halotolerans]